MRKENKGWKRLEFIMCIYRSSHRRIKNGKQSKNKVLHALTCYYMIPMNAHFLWGHTFCEPKLPISEYTLPVSIVLLELNIFCEVTFPVSAYFWVHIFLGTYFTKYTLPLSLLLPVSSYILKVHISSEPILPVNTHFLWVHIGLKHILPVCNLNSIVGLHS